nr:hypothetical protein [uncultured Rhodopila sp.]
MKFQGFIIAGFAAVSFVSTAAPAQTRPDADRTSTNPAASAIDSSTGAQKQQTRGSAALQAPQYGGAQKQHTQGSAGVMPQQYGTEWARTRKQPNNE